MPHYTAITIIYNPKSSNNGKELALQLQSELRDYGVQSELIGTKHAGHGEQLAYEYACASTRPLIVSASGDGGYHEIVNGLMRAQVEQDARPTAGLLPGGNANDHFRNMHEHDLAKAIKNNVAKHIDVLSLAYDSGTHKDVRYAHSYIGLGLTPIVGTALKQKNPKSFPHEIWVSLLVTLRVKHTPYQYQGKEQRFYSLVFSNIGSMSKSFSLARSSSPNDGLFEVSLLQQPNVLRLFMVLVPALMFGFKGDKKYKSYSFATIKPTLIQLDGEIQTLPANTEISVGILKRSLRSIV